MTLTQAQIDAVIKAGLFDASGMTDPGSLHDAAYDALVNEAPELRSRGTPSKTRALIQSL